jgi:choice-of-anchor C domain-containing protein
MRAMRFSVWLVSLLLVAAAGWSGASAAAPPAAPGGYTVTASLDRDQVLVGSTVTVRGRVLPAAPHYPVELQRQVGDTWRTVATATLGAGSRYEISTVLDDIGSVRLRVVKAARGPVASGASPELGASADTVELAAETEVLTDAAVAAITSYDATTGALTFGPEAGLSDVRVGSILAAGYSEKTPEGLLRRVTAVTRTATGGWSLATRKATVEEAIGRTQGEQSISATLVSQQVTPSEGVLLNGASRSRSFAPSVALPSLHFHLAEELTSAASNTNGTTRQISLTGAGKVAVDATLDVNSSAEMVWDQDWFSVNRVRMAFHTNVTSVATTDSVGEISGSATINLADVIRVYDVQLGPLPIVITDNTELPLSLQASLSGGRRITETSSDSFAVGFDYQKDNGGFHSVFEHSGDHDITLDDSWRGVEFDLSIGVKEKVKLYGALGLTASLGAYVKGVPGADSCPLTVGMRLEAGLVLGWDALFAKYEWENSERVDIPYLELDPCLQAPPGPEIITTVLPDAEVGAAYDAQLTTLDGRSGYWTFLGASLPQGLELRSDGLLHGTPESAGTFPIEVRFTDLHGESTTATLTLHVQRLSIDTSALVDGPVGVPYVDILTASGTPGPYTWELVEGAPPGLEVGANGYVTGTPTQLGSGTMRVRVTDPAGGTAVRSVSWVIGELPPPVDPPPPGTPVGTGTLPPTCGSACGTTWGDPHLVSFDGIAFDAQRVGELVLVDSDQDDLEVQVRQQPWRGSRLVSVNTATAMSVNGDRVGLYLTATGVRTLVDGTEVAASATPTALAGGGRIAFDTAGRLITVYWPDGSFVSASYEAGSHITLRVSLAAERRAHVSGLLGDADGVRANDHRSRSGDVIDPQVSMSDLLTTFVDTWRVNPAESLFDYEEGQSTASLTDPAFPYVTISASNLPDANVSAAFAACQAAGVVGQAALEACALDVALSGDVSLAGAALVAQSGATAGDNLVANGSFEEPQVGGSFTSIGAGGTMGAWRVTGGDLDLIHGLWTAAAGTQSLDLNGCSPARIEQDLTLEPGQRYVLRYAYAGNPGGGGVRLLHAEVDGSVVDRRSFDTSGRSTGAMGWASAVTSFVATEADTTLAFQSDNGSCYGPALDAVAVTPVAGLGSVVASSAPGDAWTDGTGATGQAMLTYGHQGCAGADRYLRCTSGTWPQMPGAPWVWAHQLTRDGEGTVTFTRQLDVTPGQAGRRMTLSALGDNLVVARVDGEKVLEGGFTGGPTSASLTLAEGPHTLSFETTNQGSYDATGNPAGLAWKLVLAD